MTNEPDRLPTLGTGSTVSVVESEVLLTSLMDFSLAGGDKNKTLMMLAYLLMMRANVFYAAVFEVTARILRDCGSEAANRISADILANIAWASDDETRVAAWTLGAICGWAKDPTDADVASAREAAQTAYLKELVRGPRK